MLGVIANQRFLGHTNPIMTAAVGDGGSILDREYIQRAARGIVDAGHLDNLKFWGVSGLAKLRNSGGVDYVPKVYDLSGNTYNAVQTTEADQPFLNSGFLSCASNDWVETGEFATPTTAATVLIWIKTTDSTTAEYICSSFYNNANTIQRAWLIGMQGGVLRVVISNVDGTTANKDYRGSITINDGDWHLIGFTFAQGTPTGTLKLYTDGSEDTTITKTTDNDVPTINSRNNIRIIGKLARATGGYVGEMNDMREYFATLTEAEIAAIYNQTSYRYA
jgi:hypothetical protein